MVVAGDRIDRGRPLRAARPAVARGRGGVRGGGRPPGPGHRLGAAGAPGRRRPRGRHRRGSSPRCCRRTATMLRVFADFGYQVQRAVRRRRGAPELPDRARPRRPCEVQRGREQRTEARSIARLLAPRGGRRLRRQRHRPGRRRGGARAPARRRLHRRRSCRCTRARRRWPGCPRTRRRSTPASPVDLAVVAVPPEAVADGGRRRGRGRGARPGGRLGRLRRGRRRRARPRSGRWSARRTRPGMRVVGPNCLGVANTDPAVRLNATLAPALPAAGPGRLLQPVRRARGGAAGRGGPARARACPASSRPATGPTCPATTCCSTGRTTPAPTWSCSTWRRSATRASSPGWPGGSAATSRWSRWPRRPARPGRGRRCRARTRRRSAALFAQSGVIRVDTVAELFDVGVLLANQPLPAGGRVGVVGNSSALTGLAATACAGAGPDRGRRLPARRRPAAPAPHEFAAALADAGGRRPGGRAGRGLRPAAARPAAPTRTPTSPPRWPAWRWPPSKPTVATFLVGRLPAGVPAYPAVEEAVRALARVRRYADWLRRAARRAARAVRCGPRRRAVRAARRRRRSGALLAAYGIEVVASAPADSVDAAVAAAGAARLPGGAEGRRAGRCGTGSTWARSASTWPTPAARAPGVRRAGRRLRARTCWCSRWSPPGVACVVEVVEDPAFGPVVGFGLGGVATELLGDRAWRAVPLTDRDAAELVDEPRAAPLLHGYRGCRAGRPGGPGRPAAAGRPAGRRAAPGAVADPQPGAGPPGRHLGAARQVRRRRGGARPDTGPRRL